MGYMEGDEEESHGCVKNHTRVRKTLRETGRRLALFPCLYMILNLCILLNVEVNVKGEIQ